MELKVALAILCQQFTFELCTSPDAVRSAERMALTLHVSGGIMMHCRPRAKETHSSRQQPAESGISAQHISAQHDVGG